MVAEHRVAHANLAKDWVYGSYQGNKYLSMFCENGPQFKIEALPEWSRTYLVMGPPKSSIENINYVIFPLLKLERTTVTQQFLSFI